MGTAERVPDALNILAKTSSVEEATKAYWEIDNHVVVQQLLFEAAVPTSACLVKILHACSRTVRPLVVELIGQIATGEADQSEIELGRENLKQECMNFIINGVACYKAILTAGNELERLYCLDILASCAQAFPEQEPDILGAISLAVADKSLPNVARVAGLRLKRLTEARRR
jgi:hypothetical protein